MSYNKVLPRHNEKWSEEQRPPEMFPGELELRNSGDYFYVVGTNIYLKGAFVFFPTYWWNFSLECDHRYGTLEEKFMEKYGATLKTLHHSSIWCVAFPSDEAIVQYILQYSS